MTFTIILCLIVIIGQSHCSQECPPIDPGDLANMMRGVPPLTPQQLVNITRDLESGYIASVSNFTLQNGPILEGSGVVLDNGEVARPTVTFTQDQIDAVERCYSGRSNFTSRQTRDVVQTSQSGPIPACSGDTGEVIFAIDVDQEVVQPILAFSAMNCQPNAGSDSCNDTLGECCEQSFCFNAVALVLSNDFQFIDIAHAITVNYCTCCRRRPGQTG